MNSRKRLTQTILGYMTEVDGMLKYAIKQKDVSFIRKYKNQMDDIVSLAARFYNTGMISHEQYCLIYDFAFRATVEQ